MSTHLPQIVTGICDAAVLKNKVVLLVHPGAITREPTDYSVETSAAADKDNLPFGVSEQAGAAVDDAIDVVISGRALVKAGGTVVPGDWVKSDANGDIVAAARAANQFCVGRSLEDGVDDDIVAIHVMPQMLTLT